MVKHPEPQKKFFYYIEQVEEGNYDLEGKLWYREKYWQAQLFILSHGINSSRDWYSPNRNGYRKKK